jgi:hypothetical protein
MISILRRDVRTIHYRPRSWPTTKAGTLTSRQYGKSTEKGNYMPISDKPANTPQMEFSDLHVWQQAVGGDPSSYCRGINTYAERWALLMQAEIAAGKPLQQVADATSRQADIAGLTGQMHHVAVCLLVNCWKYGDQLAAWYGDRNPWAIIRL